MFKRSVGIDSAMLDDASVGYERVEKRMREEVAEDAEAELLLEELPKQRRKSKRKPKSEKKVELGKQRYQKSKLALWNQAVKSVKGKVVPVRKKDEEDYKKVREIYDKLLLEADTAEKTNAPADGTQVEEAQDQREEEAPSSSSTTEAASPSASPTE